MKKKDHSDYANPLSMGPLTKVPTCPPPKYNLYIISSRRLIKDQIIKIVPERLKILLSEIHFRKFFIFCHHL